MWKSGKRKCCLWRRGYKAWVPQHIQKQLHALHDAYPDGFRRVKSADKEEEEQGEADMEIAQLQLKRYVTLQRAKLKLRSILLFSSLGVRVNNAAVAAAAAQQQAGDADAGAPVGALPKAVTFPAPTVDDLDDPLAA